MENSTIPEARGKAAAMDTWLAQGGGTNQKTGRFRSGPMKGMTYDGAKAKFEGMWDKAPGAIKDKYAKKGAQATALAPSEKPAVSRPNLGAAGNRAREADDMLEKREAHYVGDAEAKKRRSARDSQPGPVTKPSPVTGTDQGGKPIAKPSAGITIPGAYEQGQKVFSPAMQEQARGLLAEKSAPPSVSRPSAGINATADQKAAIMAQPAQVSTAPAVAKAPTTQPAVTPAGPAPAAAPLPPGGYMPPQLNRGGGAPAPAPGAGIAGSAIGGAMGAATGRAIGQMGAAPAVAPTPAATTPPAVAKPGLSPLAQRELDKRRAAVAATPDGSTIGRPPRINSTTGLPMGFRPGDATTGMNDGQKKLAGESVSRMNVADAKFAQENKAPIPVARPAPAPDQYDQARTDYQEGRKGTPSMESIYAGASSIDKAKIVGNSLERAGKISAGEQPKQPSMPIERPKRPTFAMARR
jgi:hypothetical protein